MYDSTVSANSAGDGGGIYALFPVTLTGTIVAGNVAPADSDINSVPNLGDHDLIGGGPGLAPLGDYGGPTPTMALLSGSPALGGGVTVSGVSTDQRGFTRGSSIDIGAFQASGSLSPQPLVVNVAADTCRLRTAHIATGAEPGQRQGRERDRDVRPERLRHAQHDCSEHGLAGPERHDGNPGDRRSSLLE